MWKQIVLLALIACGIGLYLNSRSSERPVPSLPEVNWGLKNNAKQSTEIRPFKIDVSPAVLTDLKYRLSHRRTYVEPLEGAAWTYGVSTKYLNKVLDYWEKEYNWSKRQELLNKYPQFKTYIQGLDIHFYHIRPTNLPKDRNLKVIPLMIIHGWPGSVVEFQKIIPMLTKPQPNVDFVFELVIPSLPGYGFSEGAVRPGMHSAQIAVLFKNLMQRLGFAKFYVQGGDWGSLVASHMAVLYPEMVTGLHSNMCCSLSLTNLIWGAFSYLPPLMKEFGYFYIQSTKPDTIGSAVSASPDGLAAYILEKFSTWTNTMYEKRDDGGLLEKYTLDELLDNIMVYWITNSITTSVRLYAEHFNTSYRDLKIEELPIKVPTACANFPNELLVQPMSWLGTRYPHIIQYTSMPRGGHFAAFEEPELLANDIFIFVKKTEELNSGTSSKNK